MSALEDAYQARDRSRLLIGALALSEIERRIAEDSASGRTSPYRTALSETLEQLSCEFAKFHASQKSCRSYLSDSIRLSRFFTPDVTEELKPYGLTTSHFLACLVAGENWPESNVEATQALVDWAVQNKADPEQIWNKRKKDNELLTKEQQLWKKALRGIDNYLEGTVTLSGEEISARRQACILFAQANPERRG